MRFANSRRSISALLARRAWRTKAASGQRADDDRHEHLRRAEAAGGARLRQPVDDGRQARGAAARARASRAARRAAARRAAGPEAPGVSATTAIGTLMKKIQRQEKSSTSQPPRIGPKIGPSSIGTPITAITRPTRCGARGAREDRHARRHDHAAAEALQDAEGDQRLRRPGQTRERRAAGEQAERDHVQPLGAEAVGGPAGERDHRRERERVAGRDPLDRRQRRLELARERVDRHVDDRHIEDRHDRAQDDDGGHEHQLAVQPGAGLARCGGRGSHPTSVGTPAERAATRLASGQPEPHKTSDDLLRCHGHQRGHGHRPLVLVERGTRCTRVAHERPLDVLGLDADADLQRRLPRRVDRRPRAPVCGTSCRRRPR